MYLRVKSVNSALGFRSMVSDKSAQRDVGLGVRHRFEGWGFLGYQKKCVNSVLIQERKIRHNDVVFFKL